MKRQDMPKMEVIIRVEGREDIITKCEGFVGVAIVNSAREEGIEVATMVAGAFNLDTAHSAIEGLDEAKKELASSFAESASKEHIKDLVAEAMKEVFGGKNGSPR